MRNVFIFLSLMMMFVLAGCGGNKYDDAINNIIDQYQDKTEKAYEDDQIKRDNALVMVYDGGKYIQIAFYNKNSERDYYPYVYYEKLGDKYEEMNNMPPDGTGDRLGLDEKTPDYEEVKGKETKLDN
ncbi:cystatin-like fold lipoprotein [Bacillus swezeyi]|uniref:cystatin-like fold lipoprotein n=1 Tax=Bacillus swezeyi TaxID=1925020 RepID=UPI002E2513A7|nr:cystatin-like fold lipoprotein [Bacillus swezeyi]